MLTTTLTNPNIKQLQDKNLKPYLLILNNENQDNSYFAFEWIVKEGWRGLINNHQNIKEIEQDLKNRIYLKVETIKK